MKKSTYILIYLFYPCSLAVLAIVLSSTKYQVYPGAYQYLIDNTIVALSLYALLYAAPFVSYFFFAKKRPFSAWLLWIGFLLYPVPWLLQDFFFPPPFYRYLGAYLAALFYTLPFVVISLVFAVIISVFSKPKEQ